MAITALIFGGIEVVENTIDEGADGKRYLVVHGDVFDLVVTQARWLALLGDKASEFALTANGISTASAAGSARPTGRCRNGPSTRSRTR